MPRESDRDRRGEKGGQWDKEWLRRQSLENEVGPPWRKGRIGTIGLKVRRRILSMEDSR